MMRILGLDYGGRRIGVAISDPLGMFAQGLPTIEYQSNKKLWRQFFAIFEKYESIEQVVIGFPYNMDGTIGTMGEEVQHFICEFKKRFPKIEIITWDERFTSNYAQRTLRDLNQKTKRQKGKIDELAAVFILQSYLDAQKNQNHISTTE